MAKLKSGVGPKSKTCKRPKKERNVEEITLGSSSDESQSEAEEEVMQVSSDGEHVENTNGVNSDLDNSENQANSDLDHSENQANGALNNSGNETNGQNPDDEPMEVDNLDDSKEKDKSKSDSTDLKLDYELDNLKEESAKSDSLDLKLDHENNLKEESVSTNTNSLELKLDYKEDLTSIQSNGIPGPLDADSSSIKVQEELPKKLHPDLKPGHVWSKAESQDIFKHLYPRVALVKLKYSKKYLNPKSDESAEDAETDRYADLLKTGTVMPLANGLSAVFKPNGDTVMLPPNIEDKIEARKKVLLRWQKESTWIPPKMGAGKKLDISGLKFGPSIRQPMLKLNKIDPE